MAKGTALVKRRKNFQRLMSVFPDRIEFYNEEIAKIDLELIDLSVCRRCGRPLKDEEARKIGYGKECLAKTEGQDDTGD